MTAHRTDLPKVVLLTILLISLLSAAAPRAVHADYARIRGTVVNVRQGPGTSHPVLFQAQQGEEFDIVSTDGLWVRVSVGEGQEAWVFGKLVDIVGGERDGKPAGEEAGGEADASSGWSLVFQIAAFMVVMIILVLSFWKRREILRFTERKLMEISGYRREQAFRYDTRKPSDDSWEI